MHTKRLLRAFVVFLSLLLMPGLLVALAQEETPAKGQLPAPRIAREEAIPRLGAFPAQTEVEPNDSNAQANFVSHGAWFATHISGVIGEPDDWDTFKFYGLEGDHIVASVAANRYGSTLDPILALWDSHGNVLAEEDDYFDYDYDTYLSYTLTEEGWYYLKISDFWGNGGSISWYDLFLWADSRADQWYETYAPGAEEPNNVKAKAFPIAYGQTVAWPRIDVKGDIDMYKFDGKAGDQVRVHVESTGLHGSLAANLSLYNAAWSLLARCDGDDWGPHDTNCFVEKTLPKTGTYYIVVTDANNDAGPNWYYWLELAFVDPYEPNNSMAQATTLPYGQTVRGLVFPGDGCDYFRFNGQAADYVTFLLDQMQLELTDSNGNTIDSNFEEWGMPFSWKLPSAGWYYLSVCGYSYLEQEPARYGAYELTAGEVMLFGAKADGKVGALSYGKGDILAYFPAANTWQLYFDGSDVGVTTNLLDFDVVQERWFESDWPVRLLMTFSAKTVLPENPAAIVAMPQDVMSFDPWELGASTGGHWGTVIDGSDIGLTTSSEVIDALDMVVSEYDEWYFSTTGAASVVSNRQPETHPPFTAQDEDLVYCYLGQGGRDTQASCKLFFDGSAAGLPAGADVNGVWIDINTGDIYLTFAAATVVNGVSYRPNDVAVCRPLNGGPVTSCAWQPKFWVGNDHGMAGKTIDGLSTPEEIP